MTHNHTQTDEILISLEEALNNVLKQKSSEDTAYYDFNYLRVCLLTEVLNNFFSKYEVKRISSPL